MGTRPRVDADARQAPGRREDEERRRRQVGGPSVGVDEMDFRLELVFVPVSDVDRAKAFYADKVGFVVDHDHQVSDDLRFVQLTPPGSACSISIGVGLSDAAPGSVRGLQVVVDDADAAREFLLAHDVDAPPVQDLPWGRFTGFSDPDGNQWAVQQLPPR